MPRLYILQVNGGGKPPYRRLVNVEDPIAFMGILRAKALKDLIDKMCSTLWKTDLERDDYQAEQLRTLKVRLYKTEYENYPDTEQEVQFLYERFDAMEKGVHIPKGLR